MEYQSMEYQSSKKQQHIMYRSPADSETTMQKLSDTVGKAFQLTIEKLKAN